MFRDEKQGDGRSDILKQCFCCLCTKTWQQQQPCAGGASRAAPTALQPPPPGCAEKGNTEQKESTATSQWVEEQVWKQTPTRGGESRRGQELAPMETPGPAPAQHRAEALRTSSAFGNCSRKQLGRGGKQARPPKCQVPGFCPLSATGGAGRGVRGAGTCQLQP